MSKRKVALVAAVLAAAGTATIVALSPTTAPAEVAPEGVTPVVAEFAYGPRELQRLDVYLHPALADAPPGSAAKPAVVLVHGGGWTHGDKESMARAARTIVNAGYTAVSVDYRLAPNARWSAPRADLRRAIRWVRANAARLQVDPARIFVLGSSAGGEIAVATATSGASREVRGVIALSPPLDLGLVAADTVHRGDSADLADVATEDLLGCAPTCTPELFGKRSALSRLDPTDPASLLFGSDAEWVDPLSSMRYYHAAKRLGLDSTLVIFEGDRHGMKLWKDAWPTILTWIQAHSDGAVPR